MIVDKISSIRIKHTTTHLYLEDSPECFTAEALDAEENTFSTIDGSAFEWSIIEDATDAVTVDSRNVLRISKFIESEYEISESIRQLESIGLSGHKTLIEGLKTGTANVQAKLLDSFYKDLRTSLIRILVVANILLEPSYPVYLLPGATVKYDVFLIKQTSVEKIILPSVQYFFESRNAAVAELSSADPSGSTIIGVSVGKTDIVLIDRNMKDTNLVANESVILPPPTAQVYVVSPDHLIFTIKNWRSSWVLEVGRTYEITIHVYTDKRQLVYLSDNLRIDSHFDPQRFKIEHRCVFILCFIICIILNI